MKTLTGFPATLTVNNVHINNCEVLGLKGIGGYVGQTQGNPTITITGYNTIQNLTLTTTDTGDDNIKTYQFNTFTQKEFLMRI